MHHVQTLRCSFSSRNQSGAVLVWIAVCTTALLGMTAYAVDISVARMQQRKIQHAADLAALSAVDAIDDLTYCDQSSPSYTATCSGRLSQIARGVVNANQVLNSEILSIKVGNWSNTTKAFTENQVPYNSVLVSADRTVSTPLGGAIFGQNSLTPVVQSVAVKGAPGNVYCPIPIGVTNSTINNFKYGDTAQFSNFAAGNWGKLDIGGKMSSNNAFRDAMRGTTCNYSVSVGDVISLGTGNAGVSSGFQDRYELNPIVVIPIIADGTYQGNSVPAVITGFAAVELLGQNGSGHNWSGNFKFLHLTTGSGIGGAGIPPFATNRGLVRVSAVY